MYTVPVICNWLSPVNSLLICVIYFLQRKSTKAKDKKMKRKEVTILD